MKKKINKELSSTEFKELYFTVSELKDYCRSVGIAVAASDRKQDLSRKVYEHLLSGKTSSLTLSKPKKDEINHDTRCLKDQQKIGVGFKFSRAARNIF